MSPQEDVARELSGVMARTSGLMLPEETVDTLLQLVTATAVRVVPSAFGAGITLLGPDGVPTSSAATDHRVLEADRLQYELQEGPCLTAYEQRTAVLVRDVENAGRWPRWEAAVAGSVGSTLSVPLVDGEDGLGAVKLYGRRPDAFDDRDCGTLRLLAGQVALLVAHRQDRTRAGRLSGDLQTVLGRRDAVTRACGVLMGREDLCSDDAFTRLVELAGEQGRPVHEAAETLLSTYGRQR